MLTHKQHKYAHSRHHAGYVDEASYFHFQLFDTRILLLTKKEIRKRKKRIGLAFLHVKRFVMWSMVLAYFTVSLWGRWPLFREGGWKVKKQNKNKNKNKHKQTNIQNLIELFYGGGGQSVGERHLSRACKTCVTLFSRRGANIKKVILFPLLY